MFVCIYAGMQCTCNFTESINYKIIHLLHAHFIHLYYTTSNDVNTGRATRKMTYEITTLHPGADPGIAVRGASPPVDELEASEHSF